MVGARRERGADLAGGDADERHGRGLQVRRGAARALADCRIARSPADESSTKKKPAITSAARDHAEEQPGAHQQRRSMTPSPRRRGERSMIPGSAGRCRARAPARFPSRGRRWRHCRRAQHGQRFAGERRHVALERATEQPRVGGHPVAFGEGDDVTGDEQRGLDLLLAAVADHRRVWWQVVLERLDRRLRLALLDERERGVEHDHRGDRHGQDRDPGDHAQAAPRRRAEARADA